MNAREVVESLEREHARINAAVDALGDGATSIAVTEPGGWTAHDVLAHLIHYTGQLAFGLGAQIVPPPYVIGVTERLEPQEWNDRAVAYWRERSLADVRAEFDRVVEALIEQIKRRNDMDAVGVIPWIAAIPLWRAVGNDTFLIEWPAHAAQLESAVR